MLPACACGCQVARLERTLNVASDARVAVDAHLAPPRCVHQALHGPGDLANGGDFGRGVDHLPAPESCERCGGEQGIGGIVDVDERHRSILQHLQRLRRCAARWQNRLGTVMNAGVVFMIGDRPYVTPRRTETNGTPSMRASCST